MTSEKQSINIQGSQNQILTVGRDLVVNDTYVQQKPEFYEPNLEAFKPPKFISPKITPQLVETIYQNKLFVLGGSIDIDKSALIRHIAWYLSETLQQSYEDKKTPILEWYRNSSDPQSIGAKLQGTSATTIFILPQISPQDVRYDLASIKKVADQNKHFVLISTDTPYPSWKLSPVEQTLFWQELLLDDLYGIDDLANVLIQELINAQDSLPKGFVVILVTRFPSDRQSDSSDSS